MAITKKKTPVKLADAGISDDCRSGNRLDLGPTGKKGGSRFPGRDRQTGG